MTLSAIRVEDLRASRQGDALFRILMQNEPEIQMVQKGCFVGPLNMDHLVEPFQVTRTYELAVEGIGSYPTSYYVCDSPEAFMDAYGDILRDDERTFIVFFTPMVKREQSPQGGWRWHKWGEYVGVGEPTTEYLYDEPKFELVYTVAICHVDL